MTSIKDTPGYRAARAALENYFDERLVPIIQEIESLRLDVEELKRGLIKPN